MTIHDWTRVDAGIYHAFHVHWLTAISGALNGGVLSGEFYALPEQDAAGYRADVLTLRSRRPKRPPPGGTGGGTATAVAPVARFTDTVEFKPPRRPARWIAVKRTRGDETVAVIELVSPGNKGSRHAFRAFVRKSVDLIERGIHLLVADLFPPTPRDRHGMHAAIWGDLTGRRFEPPAGEPLTLASYEAGRVVRAFVEPTAVGRPLPDMPLFLEPGRYVTVPLAAAYQTAWAVFPARWREELEPG